MSLFYSLTFLTPHCGLFCVHVFWCVFFFIFFGGGGGERLIDHGDILFLAVQLIREREREVGR